MPGRPFESLPARKPVRSTEASITSQKQRRPINSNSDLGVTQFLTRDVLCAFEKYPLTFPSHNSEHRPISTISTSASVTFSPSENTFDEALSTPGQGIHTPSSRALSRISVEEHKETLMDVCAALMEVFEEKLKSQAQHAHQMEPWTTPAPAAGSCMISPATVFPYGTSPSTVVIAEGEKAPSMKGSLLNHARGKMNSVVSSVRETISSIPRGLISDTNEQSAESALRVILKGPEEEEEQQHKRSYRGGASSSNTFSHDVQHPPHSFVSSQHATRTPTKPQRHKDKENCFPSSSVRSGRHIKSTGTTSEDFLSLILSNEGGVLDLSDEKRHSASLHSGGESAWAQPNYSTDPSTLLAQLERDELRSVLTRNLGLAAQQYRVVHQGESMLKVAYDSASARVDELLVRQQLFEDLQTENKNIREALRNIHACLITVNRGAYDEIPALDPEMLRQIHSELDRRKAPLRRARRLSSKIDADGAVTRNLVRRSSSFSRRGSQVPPPEIIEPDGNSAHNLMRRKSLQSFSRRVSLSGSTNSGGRRNNAEIDSDKKLTTEEERNKSNASGLSSLSARFEFAHRKSVLDLVTPPSLSSMVSSGSILVRQNQPGEENKVFGARLVPVMLIDENDKAGRVVAHESGTSSSLEQGTITINAEKTVVPKEKLEEGSPPPVLKTSASFAFTPQVSDAPKAPIKGPSRRKRPNGGSSNVGASNSTRMSVVSLVPSTSKSTRSSNSAMTKKKKRSKRSVAVESELSSSSLSSLDDDATERQREVSKLEEPASGEGDSVEGQTKGTTRVNSVRSVAIGRSARKQVLDDSAGSLQVPLVTPPSTVQRKVLPEEEKLAKMNQTAAKLVHDVHNRLSNSQLQLIEKGKAISKSRKRKSVSAKQLEANPKISDSAMLMEDSGMSAVDKKSLLLALQDEVLQEVKDLASRRDELGEAVQVKEDELNVLRADIKTLSAGSPVEREELASRLIKAIGKKAKTVLAALSDEDATKRRTSTGEENEDVFSTIFSATDLLEGVRDTANASCQTGQGDVIEEGSDNIDEDLYKQEQLVMISLRHLMVAAANLLYFHSSLEIEASCKHCLRVFDRPCILWPCGHSFCETCIQSMSISAEHYMCSECHVIAQHGYTYNPSLNMVCLYQKKLKEPSSGRGAAGDGSLDDMLRSLIKELHHIQQEIQTFDPTKDSSSLSTEEIQTILTTKSRDVVGDLLKGKKSLNSFRSSKSSPIPPKRSARSQVIFTNVS